MTLEVGQNVTIVVGDGEWRDQVLEVTNYGIRLSSGWYFKLAGIWKHEQLPWIIKT